MGKPRLRRQLKDPWLTRRLDAATAVARVELAVQDVVTAGYAAALAEVWWHALDARTDLTAAGVPYIDAAIQAARQAWRTVLDGMLRPLIHGALADRWRAVHKLTRRRVSDTELARYAALAVLPNRLADEYWRVVADRLGASVDEVFEQVRGELAEAQARGESIAQIRDRIARVLQLDSGTSELRDELARVEARLHRPDLTQAERDELLEQRTNALHTVFSLRAKEALARARLRVAEALRRVAVGKRGPERDDLENAAEAEVARAARLNPGRDQIRAAQERVEEIDQQLHDLSDTRLRDRRRALREEIAASEQGWRARATRVARTETMAVLNGGTVDASREIGQATGVRMHKTWLATHDDRTRPTHQVADGQTVPITDPFTVGGFPLQYPGDPTGPPGEVIHCRCTVTLEDDDDLALYDSLAASAPQEDTVADTPTATTPTQATPPLVVEAADNAPIEPPAEWFTDPRLPGPTPITVTREGRVLGHVAQWDACHAAYQGVCVSPPRSESGYAYFHYGSVIAANGEVVRVGKLTVGGGHAGPNDSMQAAIEHYDDVSTAVAVVRAGEDEHGPWVAGAIRPGATPEQIYDLLTSPLSGDWRQPPSGGGLELVAAHAVNVPGFGIRASAGVLEGEGQVSLVSAGVLDPDPSLSLDPEAAARRAEAAKQRHDRVAALAASIGRDPRSRVDQLAASIGRDPKTRADDIARSIGL